MIILRPDWVTHADDKKKTATIFTLHLHPNGKKLATGSLDAKIKIWDTRPLFNPEDEMNEDIPKLLSTLINHQGTVLCLRWSNIDGEYLASGSDDKIIIIWKYNSALHSNFSFGSDNVNVENYSVVKRLTGHESDVVDLAWSQDNMYLASCGLDSKICIWDGSTFERLQCLVGHEGFVKGVTWDPVGKYLASQSDDRTVKIWRTSDWKLETTIMEPFKNTPSTTFYRRLSWSPDGSYIVTANAMNENHYIAAVVHRENWNTSHSFIGHIAPVEVALFNPVIFQKTIVNGGNEENVSVSICAVGSQDRGISIWRTETNRAIIVANDIFDHSILDMTWSNDGLSLIASSYDGSIAILQFTEQEFGKPLKSREVDEILDKYGYSKQKVTAIEDTVQLNMEEEISKLDKAQATNRIAKIMGESILLNNNGLMKKSPSLRLDGSTTLAPTPAPTPTTTPTSANAENQNLSLDKMQADTNNTNQDSKKDNTATDDKKNKSSNDTDNKDKDQDNKDENNNKDDKNNKDDANSKEKKDKGKGKISETVESKPKIESITTSTKITTATATASSSSSFGFPSSSSTSISINNINTLNPRPKNNMDDIFSRPIIQKVTQTKEGKKRIQPMHISNLPSVSSSSLPQSQFTLDRYDFHQPDHQIRQTTSTLPTNGFPILKRKHPNNDGSITNVKKIFTKTDGEEEKQQFILPTLLPLPTIPTILAIPKIPKLIYYKIPHDENLLSTKIIECDNSKKPITITCHEDDEILWTDVMTSHVLHIASSEEFIVVACRDGSLILYSLSGRRLIPVIVLPTPVTYLDTNGPYLLTLNASGLIDIWNVIKQESIISSVSIGLLLKYNSLGKSNKNDVSILNITLRSDGTPVITTTNGKTFAYHIKMKTFICLSTKKSQESSYSNKVRTSLTQLEDELASLKVTNSAQEYRRVLGIYVRRLSDELAIGKIKEICDDFLGPIQIAGAENTELLKWESKLIGMPKHELLEEILLILGRNRELQRITTQYKEQLEEYKKARKN
ncbi:WD40 repeat-like protein [Anaeromyces robustus]|uniref:Protein HIR n=1 Tax=Anaeromyces robustus TaxID=1754192 RepID=A0A1Y1WQJ4_9FUNG|nr:WD40 repeat-like protein [Anaeromyces robustus]|eukprot:ORX75807.1 WD40 repeat-like protein [Anaeromyces robustus]